MTFGQETPTFRGFCNTQKYDRTLPVSIYSNPSKCTMQSPMLCFSKKHTFNFPLLYRCSVGCGKLCLRRVNPALLNPCHRWPVVMPVRTLTAAPTVQEVHHPWEILVCSPITLQSVVFTCPRFSLDLDIENDSDLLKTVPIRHNTYKFIRYF